ncbi:MAG: lactate 2-monooxygenase [Chloroflexi bacterium]|nr:MAG: lactate 2-monooxygenase [Chloroflexota bacterium]
MSNGRKRQTDIYIPGMSGRRPRVPVDMAALERAAQRKLSPPAFAYLAGGAGREETMSHNREAFARWRIVPRMLRNIAQRDTSVSLLGETLPSPFLLSPIGVLELAHPEADLAVARAAAAEGVPMIFSNQASVPMEETAKAMGDGVRWFQLYYSSNDELVQSFLRRAENCGCSAIVVTLDTTLLGWRTRDLDLAYLPFLRGMGIAQYTSDPVFNARIAQPAPSELDEQRPKLTLSLLRAVLRLRRTYPDRDLNKARRAVREFIGTYSRPTLTWDDISRLREMTKLPILLKGILHPEDAKIAIERGINGLIVSNHGGRQVDGSIAALDALPSIVEAVGGKIHVLMDSGIRGGADAFKALALGATAVCIGRPYAFGLAVAGEHGVREVLQNFKADFDLTMGLAGYAAARDIDRAAIVRAED